MKLLVLTGIGLVLAGGIGAAASSDAEVTLSMRQYTNQNRIHVFVWSGRIASSGSGEYVEVLGRDCLTNDFRLYTSTQSGPGGGWEVESVSYDVFPPSFVQVYSGTTFRARWQGQLSDPVSYRAPLSNISALKRKRGTWTVSVNPTPRYMKLAGRVVVLQRRQKRAWVTYRSARLVHKPTLDYGGATNYQATFKVAARGLQLRAYVPAKSAAPCYLAGASKPWRS